MPGRKPISSPEHTARTPVYHEPCANCNDVQAEHLGVEHGYLTGKADPAGCRAMHDGERCGCTGWVGSWQGTASSGPKGAR